MNDRKFQRTIEDFTCENCAFEVVGSGYTNHCPNCLWSKHVDIQPGDRLEKCVGMMEPIEVTLKSGEYRVLHHCNSCDHEKWNQAAKSDNFEILIKISEQKFLR